MDTFRKFYFSKHGNTLISLLEKYPNKPWNWNEISWNSNITMDYIEKHPDKPWNWDYISSNPNLTMEFIEKHPEKDWNWNCISDNPNITIQDVEKHPEKNWNWYYVSRNPNLTLEYIDKHLDKLSFMKLSDNKFIYDDTICRKYVNQYVKTKCEHVQTSLYQVTNICLDVIRLITIYCSYF